MKCVVCNTDMREMKGYDICNYHHIEGKASPFIGWCLFASKKLSGLFSKEAKVYIVPVPYVCPNCHKLEFYISDSDYENMQQFELIRSKDQ